jgi:hypothetical protein
MAMADGSHGTTHGIRASDAERERTAAQLKQHFLDGRLSTDEYSERLDATYAARTREQLQALLDDLPPLAAPEPPLQPARPWWRGISPPVAVLALIAALWLTGWLLGGHSHGFVPLWPLLIAGFFLLRWGAWRSRARRDRRYGGDG